MTKFKKYIEEELSKINDFDDIDIKIEKKSQKIKEMGVDDLINFINQEDNKPKKIKKKNNKKNKNLKIIEKPLGKDKIDSEIEEFKNILKLTSVHKFTVRKIKPIFSDEWLSSLQKVLLK
jgi:hypothetical protein